MAQVAWSAQQQEIFNWFENPGAHIPGKSQHLTVTARAGCGKTTTLMEGVLRAPESNILICAFSKIIQNELQSRIPKNRCGIRAQTLHSLGFSLIRKFRDRISVDFSSARADAITEAVTGVRVPDAIKKTITKLHTKAREIAPHARHPEEIEEIAYNFDCLPDEEWAASGFPLEYVLDKALEAMEWAANISNGAVIDGSDMIYLPVRNHWLRPMFDLVVVDEAQDMTTAQLEIAQGVLKPNGRICVVGDDRQAIFGFRGADSDSLERLTKELNSQQLGLTVTYRCGRSIVEWAQRLVPDFEAGPNNPAGELLNVNTASVVELAGPGDFILSRMNAPLVGVALQLLKAGKRARVAGKDISKGLLSLIRKLRARSVPHFIEKVGTWKDREVLRHQKALEVATGGKKMAIENKIEAVIDQAEMLINLAEGAKNVQEITTRVERLFEDDGLGMAGVITCSSVHKAKGLEAKRVFIYTETLRNYNKEEQNIEYVAITRAKETLFLAHSGGPAQPTPIDA